MRGHLNKSNTLNLTVEGKGSTITEAIESAKATVFRQVPEVKDLNIYDVQLQSEGVAVHSGDGYSWESGVVFEVEARMYVTLKDDLSLEAERE